MNTTILLLSFNGASVIGEAIASLLPLPEHVRLLVLDNGSHDESVAIVKEFAAQHPQVTVVEHATNLGFSGGMNNGIRLAMGQIPHPAISEPAEFVVLFNQDARALPGWHEAIISPFAEDPRIAAVGCLIYDEAGQIEHLGAYLELPQGIARHVRLDSNMAIPDDVIDVEYATGAALALRTSALSSVGLFDERYYPAYCEEIDLCYRFTQADFRVVVNPAACVTHLSKDNNLDMLERLRMYNRGRLLLMLKTQSYESFITHFAPAELQFINDHAGHTHFVANQQAYADALLYFDSWIMAHEELHVPLAPEQRKQLHTLFVQFQQRSILNHTQSLTMHAQIEQLDGLIKTSEQIWNLQHIHGVGAKQTVVLQAFQRLLGPLVERQTNVNAALVHVLYWLMEFSQRSMRTYQQHQRASTDLEIQLSRLERLTTTIQTEINELSTSFNDGVNDIATTQAHLHRLITLLNGSLRTNAEQFTTLLTHLTTENVHEHHDPAPEL